MARDLSDTIRTAFAGVHNYCHCYSRYNTIPSPSITKYLEIPINEDVFEVPLFAFLSFVNAVKDNKDTSTNAIVTVLKCINYTSGYKTVDRCMRDVLYENYRNSKLVVVEAKKGDDTIRYYGTHGAVFNDDFQPIAMCSWQIERYWNDIKEIDGKVKGKVARYKFLKPILRISPYVYLEKDDTMERYLVNKLMTACLENGVNYPPSGYTGDRFDTPSWQECAHIKIEIDYTPFVVRETLAPSISTSNKQLLQLAIDHIEEVLQ